MALADAEILRNNMANKSRIPAKLVSSMLARLMSTDRPRIWRVKTHAGSWVDVT